MRSPRRAGIAVLMAVLFACAPSATAGVAGQPSTAAATNHVPVYAYFYQWFERSSWDRAKQDFPLAGHYSSDDPHVLRRQIEQARWAGIDGFLTSWKSTDALNRRLRLLLRMAALTHFDVGVVYEALDFYRHPLPIATVLSDLTYLADTWVGSMHSAFGRPVIIWTGTNEYSRADIAAVHRMLAGRAYLLAASKNVADYQRIAGLVDGEAYYWSSANPRSSGTSVKLREMAAAVHAHHEIWICPAAPGFDGRPLGHTRVIDRANGSTFAHSLDVARQSSPSAIGVISWNEWSENTYIEPGRRYGRRELDVLHAYTSSRDTVTHVPASATSSRDGSSWTGLRAGGILVLLTSVGITVLVAVGRRPLVSRKRGRRSHSRTARRDTPRLAGTHHGGRS
jgi:hypothetical protein